MIIAIASMKGGTGKSTIANMMATTLVSMGMNVLVVDGDWQSELTRLSGASTPDKTLFDVMTNQVNIEDAIMEHTAHGYHIVSGSMNLMDLNTNPSFNVSTLKIVLAKLRGRYDHIIIDTPPSFGAQLKACLEAADCVVVPIQGKPMDSMFLQMLAQVIEEVKQRNNTLYVAGVLQTFYNPERMMDGHTAEILNTGLEALKTKLFEARILDLRYVYPAEYMDSYITFVKEFLGGVKHE